MRRPHVHHRSASRAPTHLGPERRVLVVSADREEGEAACGALAGNGCVVRNVRGITEAVELMAGYHPQTVLVMGLAGSARGDYAWALPALRRAEPGASIVVALDDVDVGRDHAADPMRWGADEVVDRLDPDGGGISKAILRPLRRGRVATPR